jgi:hypothetical protein
LTGCSRNDDRSSPRASKPPLQTQHNTTQTHTAKASRNETRRSTCSHSTTLDHPPLETFTNAQLACQHAMPFPVIRVSPSNTTTSFPHSKGNAGQILAPNRTLGLLVGLCARNGASSREEVRDHSLRRNPQGEEKVIPRFYFELI